MKTGFKWIGKDSYRVVATGEQFQRWSRGLERMVSNKYYSMTVRRENAGYLEYIKGIFELYMALYDPKHKPKGRFEFYGDGA